MAGGLRNTIVRIEILAGFLLLLVACGLAIIASANSSRAFDLASQSLRARHAIDRLFGEIKDAETGQRGYLLTGKSDYLVPYHNARRELEQTRSELRTIMAHTNVQLRLVGQLDTVIDQKMAELEHTIQLYDTTGPASALAIVNDDQGLALMTRIRTLIRQLDSEESDQEQMRLHQFRLQQQLLLAAIIASTLVAFILTVLVIRQGDRQQTELALKNAVLKEQMRQQSATEAQLRHVQKMETLGQLTGGIAHDFNNMLAVVVGNLEIAQLRLDRGTGDTRKFIQNALLGAGKASDLTKRLLAFSRRQALRPTAVDVNACVHEMSAILVRTLGENITIDLRLAEQLWPAFVDRSQLESAILNLAVNSRDAMEGHGQLIIATANVHFDEHYADQHEDVAAGEYVMVAVSDTGHGMAPEVIQRVFEPFFTTKAVGRGTGLGLSQIHGFILQSNGHIKIESTPGVGTTIKLYLPNAPAGSTRLDPHQTPVAALPHVVLVVEDNPDVRELAKGALEELGYTALEADSAEAAELVLKEHPEVSILLTDVVMPGPSGVSLAKEMTRRYPNLRALLMSGYPQDMLDRAQPRHDRTRLLAKPFTIRELAEALRGALNDE
ncbi:CHASE3 domain-containing protein [Dyella sp.]|uniref:CHASE3 domain-containing protein n=1 Tax=Dyella sp. TaxID=1869338 RepID=UPI002B45D2F0|nr:CHASE3 domain-containing protein [Dyella sp.]HKT30554.1 CHASE3 domain-containing protein [Dyella sp.]